MERTNNLCFRIYLHEIVSQLFPLDTPDVLILMPTIVMTTILNACKHSSASEDELVD